MRTLTPIQALIQAAPITLIALSLLATGCSSHSGATPSPSYISPDVFQRKVSQNGWTTLILPKINGLAVTPLEMAADSDHREWVSVQYGNSGAMEEILMNGRLKTYPTSVVIRGVTLGPDGNLWGTAEYGIVVRFTTNGTETDYPVAPGMGMGSVINGSDGALWFGECSKDSKSGGFGRMDIFGSYTFYSASVCPSVVASGSDGNIWFTGYSYPNDESVYVMTTQAVLVAQYPTAYYRITALVAASDDLMYFTGGNNSPQFDLVRVNQDGTFTNLGGDNNGDTFNAMVSGPDENLWMSYYGIAHSRLIRFNFASQTFDARIPGPVDGGFELAVGPDGNMWLSNFQKSSINIYVRLALSLSPKNISVPVGQNATLNVSETNYSGQWTAVSTNPSIATVTPNSNGGTFVVTGVAPGTTSVTVYDTTFNSAPVSVKVP